MPSPEIHPIDEISGEKPRSESSAYEVGPEQKSEIERLQKELASIAESANDLEENVIVEPDPGTEESGPATLVGKVRDLAYRLSRSAVMQALLLGAATIGGTDLGYKIFHGSSESDPVRIEMDNSTSETNRARQPEKEHLIYGSPEYKEKLNNLKQKLAAAGVTGYDPSGGKGLDAFWNVLDADANHPDTLAIEDAIAHHNHPIEEKEQKEHESVRATTSALKEKTRMPNEAFNAVLAKINYEHLFETSSRRFGIDPLRRVGYHQYQNFNQDVLEVARLMNERIARLDTPGRGHYPPLSPGLISAVALQEGFAPIIDREGYNPSTVKNSYSQIGLDALGGAMPGLEAEGLLDAGYEARAVDYHSPAGLTNIEQELFGPVADQYKHAKWQGKNEAGMATIEVNMSERNLLEGLAALVAEKRKFLIDYLGEPGWRSFDPDEQNWLTYAAYQWGEGNVIDLVQNGTLHVRDSRSPTIPITRYPKYQNGVAMGRVANVHDYIFKDDGRKFATRELTDFHMMAAQVAVSAKVSDAFFQNLQ